MIRRCKQCGKANRVPAAHLSDRGRCGACKSELAPVARPIEVNVEQFDDIVKNAKVPVLVDFWAPWCGPCRMAAPIVSRLASDRAGEAVVLKVNTETHPRLAARYKIRGIPNFIVFRNGVPTHQQAGLTRQQEMNRWLE